MSTTIPLTVTQEAADYVAEKNLRKAFQQMLDNISVRFLGAQAITVSLAPPYDEGSGPEVIFEVTRCKPDSEDDLTEEDWRRWIVETFPPEVFTHFCLFSNFVLANVG